MTKRSQTIAETAGGILVVTGLALVSIPAALVLAGIGLIAVGNLPARRAS